MDVTTTMPTSMSVPLNTCTAGRSTNFSAHTRRGLRMAEDGEDLDGNGACMSCSMRGSVGRMMLTASTDLFGSSPVGALAGATADCRSGKP